MGGGSTSVNATIAVCTVVQAFHIPIQFYRFFYRNSPPFLHNNSIDSSPQVMMQKYLVSFVLTGNPNTKWSSDKLYWPKYNSAENSTESTALVNVNSTTLLPSPGTQLVFNDTFYLSTDDLATKRTLLWNKALWY